MSDGPKVVVHFGASPGRTEALKQILMDLRAASRAEEGCMRFELWQNETTPSSFIFIEEWDSREHFNAHLKAAHLQEAKSRMAGLLREAQDIRVCKLVG